MKGRWMGLGVFVIMGRLRIVKHLMFKDQVYNPVERSRGELSPNRDTFRRLNRRIHYNMGLLNTSRSSNHSSSFRMRRTELSNERYNLSRDNTQHFSGLNSQEANDSRNHSNNMAPNNQTRRRLRYEPSRIAPQQPPPKNMVENLYMLDGNQRQHNNARERLVRPNQLAAHSPRTYQSPNLHEGKRNENSRDKYERRSGSQSRESRLVQRKSKEQSRIRESKHSSSRGQRYNPQAEPSSQRPAEDPNIKRLSEKYLDNVYELKSPRGRKEEKKQSEKQIPYQYGNQHANQYRTSNASTKNMNQYYFQQTQISSTSGGTVGVKTMPGSSKVQTISEASLPVHSVASHKEIASKGSISPRAHQKNYVRVDRTKQKNRNEAREKRKEKQGASRLSIKLKDPVDQRQPKRKQKQCQQREQQLLLGSVFLPVQSKRQQGRQWAQDILQRIILHLECLNIIADYTKEFRKMYENTEQWEVLIFLSYKKFYIERTKVAQVLRAPPVRKEEESRLMVGLENPFVLPYSKVSQEELVRFRGSRECLALRQELEAEDSKIRNALRGLYNLYIEKSGQHVNMLDCDNFSEEIFRLMLEELEGIAENLEEPALVEPTKLRMGKIIRSGLLIAYLEGRYVKNFAQILLHEDTVKLGKREALREDCAADLYLAEFKRVLS